MCIWDGIWFWVEASLSVILAQTQVVAGLHMRHQCSTITPAVCNQLRKNTCSSVTWRELCQTDTRNATQQQHPFNPRANEYITREPKKKWTYDANI